MTFLDLTMATPEQNLALDEALLTAAETGRASESLRVWESARRMVVLGSGGKLAEDVDELACRADGVPILRRASGGGTVLLGEGCLCFSLVLAYERDPVLQSVRSSYEFILGRIVAGLADLVPNAARAGTSDLAVGDRKFSGNAQQRKQKFLLHHGTLLHGFDFALMGRYLRQPARQPEYRADRDHQSFLMNLPFAGAELKHLLRVIWRADAAVATVPTDLVDRLVIEKYSTEEWIRRR